MKELIPFFVSMLPVVELRGAIPLALSLGVKPLEAFFLCVIGNMVPVPLILFSLYKMKHFLVKIPIGGKLLVKIEERAHKKKRIVEKYGYFGLFLFVSIPLPGSGAWTGSFISFLLDLDVKKSLISIFLGVVVAGLIILLGSLGTVKVFSFFV